MAWGAAIGTGLSLAGQTDSFTLGQTFGDFYLNGLGLSFLADGNGFFAAIDQFLQSQRDVIFQIFAPYRGLPAASAAASPPHVLGKGVAAHT